MAENKKNAVDELDEELKEEQLSEDTEKDEDTEAQNKDLQEQKQKELLGLIMAQAKKCNNKLPEKDVNKILKQYIFLISMMSSGQRELRSFLRKRYPRTLTLSVKK